MPYGVVEVCAMNIYSSPHLFLKQSQSFHKQRPLLNFTQKQINKTVRALHVNNELSHTAFLHNWALTFITWL
jgi:hypothetical protein